MKRDAGLKSTKLFIADLLAFVRKHWLVIITLIGASMAIIAMTKIQSAISAPPSQKVYDEELANFKTITFDEEVIAEIVKLTSRDITINPKLPDGRNNPFLD